MSGSDEWRSQQFRQSVIARIDDAIRSYGMSTSRKSIEMLNHVFVKAKTREEYLGFVERFILHVNELNKKKSGMQTGPPQTGGMPDPINALQNLASQGTRNNQMLNMGPQQNPMGGPQQQMGMNVFQTLGRGPGGAMANMQGNMQNRMGANGAQMGNQMNGQMGGMNQMGGQMPAGNMNQLGGTMQGTLGNQLQGNMQNQMGNQQPGGQGQLQMNPGLQNSMGGPMGSNLMSYSRNLTLAPSPGSNLSMMGNAVPPRSIGTRNNQMLNMGPQQNPMGGPQQQMGMNVFQTLGRGPGGAMANMQGNMQNRMGANGAQMGNQMNGQMGGMNQMGGQMPAGNMNQLGGTMQGTLGNQLQGNMQNQMGNQQPGGQGQFQMNPGLQNWMGGPMGSNLMSYSRNPTPTQFLQQIPSPSVQSPAGMGGPSTANQMVPSPALAPSPGSNLSMMGNAGPPRSIGTRNNQMLNMGPQQNPMGGPQQQMGMNVFQTLGRGPGGAMANMQGNMQNRMGANGAQMGNQMNGQMGGMNQMGGQMPAGNMNQLGGTMQGTLGNQLQGNMQNQMGNQQPGGQGQFQMNPGLQNWMGGPMGSNLMSYSRNPTQFLQQIPSPSVQSPAGMGGPSTANQMVPSPALAPSPGSNLSMMGNAGPPRSIETSNRPSSLGHPVWLVHIRGWLTLRNIWLKSLGVCLGYRSSWRICNNHFSNESYLDPRIFKLRRDATPMTWVFPSKPVAELVKKEEEEELSPESGHYSDPGTPAYEHIDIKNSPESPTTQAEIKQPVAAQDSTHITQPIHQSITPQGSTPQIEQPPQDSTRTDIGKNMLYKDVIRPKPIESIQESNDISTEMKQTVEEEQHEDANRAFAEYMFSRLNEMSPEECRRKRSKVFHLLEEDDDCS